MSILLDALKKSEEQRQLGKTPEIHDHDDYRPDKAPQGGRPWIPVVLTAVAAVLIFAIVWQQFREPPAEAVSGEPVVAQRALPQVGATDSRPPAKPPEAAAEARTPVESFESDEPQSGNESQPGAGPGDDQKRQELARSFSQFQQPEPEPGAETPADQQAAEPPAAQAPGPARQRSTSTSQRAGTEPISYWELPQTVRDSMPQLRISVMVYAEAPEDRFLLINGRRLVEQQSVDGVELEEIRRDGAVFSYRNYRFLLKD